MTVQFWRYVLPPIQHEGWAIVVLGSDGFFATVSDYGNYAFLWNHRGEGVGMREFVARLDGDYVRRKLDPGTVLDYRATRKALGDRLISGLLDPDGDRARDELESVVDDVHLMAWSKDWGHLLWPDWHEEIVYRPRPAIRAFVEKALPRLQEMIRAELAKEAALKVEGIGR